jgi:hypothetical protein
MKLLSKITGLFSLAFIMSSFSHSPGGEGFEVYLNNRLIIQQFGADVQQVKSIQLTKESASEKLTIKYYHCGRCGLNRTVIVKDQSDRALKTFHYPNTTNNSAMEVPLKDILTMKGITSLKLFYSSDQLPRGRDVLAINTSAKDAVAVR